MRGKRLGDMGGGEGNVIDMQLHYRVSGRKRLLSGYKTIKR